MTDDREARIKALPGPWKWINETSYPMNNLPLTGQKSDAFEVFISSLHNADRVIVETQNALGCHDCHYMPAPEILNAWNRRPATPDDMMMMTKTNENRYLGNFSSIYPDGVYLSCDHCNVAWTGCAAESMCPECGRGKGYRTDDRNECYCPECMPHFFEAERRDEGGSMPDPETARTHDERIAALPGLLWHGVSRPAPYVPATDLLAALDREAKLLEALELAIGLGVALGMTEMEVDAINLRAALAANKETKP